MNTGMPLLLMLHRYFRYFFADGLFSPHAAFLLSFFHAAAAATDDAAFAIFAITDAAADDARTHIDADDHFSFAFS